MSYKPPNQKKGKARHLLNKTAHQISHHGLTIAVRLVLGLFTLISIGTLLLMLPAMGANGRLTFSEAAFTATSALTVTGLSVISPTTDLTFIGKVTLLILIQIGGVGFMFIAVIFLQLLGRKILITQRLALANSLGLNKPEAILTLLWQIFIGVILIECTGALLLFFRWLEFFPPLTALWYAVFHAVSAFCNAGFDLFNGAYTQDGAAFVGIPSDSISLLVMGALILVGGLGIPVIADLLAFRGRQKLSNNSRITILVIAFLTIGGWLSLLVSEGFGAGVVADAPTGEKLVRTLFQSISNRTAGFAGLPNYSDLQPASLILTMAMLFIGCAPASMGGGITTGTFSVLMLSLYGFASGENQPTIWGRSIPRRTIQRAGAILTISLMLLGITTWLILLTHPMMALDVALFETVSAFATGGLSLGATGQMNWFGRIILMILMFWGRLGPLSVVIAITQRRSNAKKLIRYAEEEILIG